MQTLKRTLRRHSPITPIRCAIRCKPPLATFMATKSAQITKSDPYTLISATALRMHVIPRQVYGITRSTATEFTKPSHPIELKKAQYQSTVNYTVGNSKYRIQLDEKDSAHSSFGTTIDNIPSMSLLLSKATDSSFLLLPYNSLDPCACTSCTGNCKVRK